jgi:hypothetical protein
MVKLSATVQWNTGRKKFQLIIRQEDRNGRNFQILVDWISTDLEVVRILRKREIPDDKVKILKAVQG